MNIDARKLTIIEKFIHIQNDDIIKQFENILELTKDTHKKEKVKSFTINEFNLRIKKSMEDSKSGKLIRHEDLKSEIKKWD